MAPLDVLRLIAVNPAAMGYLDDASCVLEHVSKRTGDGADDARLDTCPCHRQADLNADNPDERPRELGEGHYVSSPRHTIADLVRDAVAADNDQEA
jgi:hypothetical protein